MNAAELRNSFEKMILSAVCPNCATVGRFDKMSQVVQKDDVTELGIATRTWCLLRCQACDHTEKLSTLHVRSLELEAARK